MSRNVISYSQTDTGLKRTENEDRFVWVQNLWNKPEMAIIGAIDGVGGYEGGAEAAELAKSVIENYFQNFSFGSPLQLLKEAVINSNNEIHKRRASNPNLNRMSCVMSVGVLDAERERIYVAHVGDSRGYIYRESNLLKLTKDHSLVGMKEDSGFLTEEEAMHHPRRNEISKMLGEVLLDAEDNEQYLEITEHSFIPNDIALFCSDGLTDLVNSENIKNILSRAEPLSNKAQLLIDKANSLGGKDNITIALATYTAPKKSDRKRVDKNTIEIPVGDENGLPSVSVKPSKKKVNYRLWLLLLMAVLLGFLANWYGTKNLLHVKRNNIDTLQHLSDSTKLIDSLRMRDTLINATDTIYSNRPNRDTIHH
jgi:PPM family protein phosphatase